MPIGSVVKLKDVERYFMIAGYFPQGSPDPNHIYDYSGFPFPMGYTGKVEVYQFDREKVESIVMLGYQDQEQLLFMEKLKADEPVLKHLEGERQ